MKTKKPMPKPMPMLRRQAPDQRARLLRLRLAGCLVPIRLE
jgi:hypothetical protein